MKYEQEETIKSIKNCKCNSTSYKTTSKTIICLLCEETTLSNLGIQTITQGWVEAEWLPIDGWGKGLAEAEGLVINGWGIRVSGDGAVTN